MQLARDILIPTTITLFVVRYAWKFPWIVAIGATGFFFIVDFTYLAANVVQEIDGGWFPLIIGAFMFTLMMTWKQGRKLMSESLRNDSIDLKSFLESVFVRPPIGVQGTRVFL